MKRKNFLRTLIGLPLLTKVELKKEDPMIKEVLKQPVIKKVLKQPVVQPPVVHCPGYSRIYVSTAAYPMMSGSYYTISEKELKEMKGYVKEIG